MSFPVKYVIWGIVGFFLLRSPYATPFLNPIHTIAIVLSFIGSFYYVHKYFSSSSVKFDFIYLFMIGMSLFLCLSRYLNGYSFVPILKSILLQVSLINLMFYFFKRDFWRKLTILDYILTAYVSINFACMLLFPNGMYKTDLSNENWFLGFKNVMVRTFIPAIIISCIVSLHYYGRLTIKNYLVYFICLASVVIGKSSTGLVVHAILGLCIIYPSILQKIRFFNLFNVFVLGVAISIAILLFGIQENFAIYIEQYLDKDATFTGRIFIWEQSFSRIVRSPIIGYGFLTSDEWRDLLEYTKLSLRITNASHPHNYVLYLLLQGGVIYFSLYLILLFLITKFSYTIRNHFLVIFLNLMYFSYFINGLTESLTGTPLLFPMIGLYMVIVEKYSRYNSFYNINNINQIANLKKTERMKQYQRKSIYMYHKNN